MVRQTVLSCKLERTGETLTAYGGLARHALATLRWTLVHVAGRIVSAMPGRRVTGSQHLLTSFNQRPSSAYLFLGATATPGHSIITYLLLRA